GRRLALKGLNAAKFVYRVPEPAADGSIINPLDLDMLAELDRVVATATTAPDALDHARALEAAEQVLRTFSDDHLALVNVRAYQTKDAAGQASAVLALRSALDVLLRLFAPFIPFATEEVWSWTHDSSVHTAAWPTAQATTDPSGLLALVGDALIGIRGAKTN